MLVDALQIDISRYKFIQLRLQARPFAIPFRFCTHSPEDTSGSGKDYPGIVQQQVKVAVPGLLNRVKVYCNTICVHDWTHEYLLTGINSRASS